MNKSIHSDIGLIQSITNYIRQISKFENRFVYLKDINLEYIIATDTCALMYGLKSGEDVRGLKDSDMPGKDIRSYASSLMKQDKNILITKRAETCIGSIAGTSMHVLHKQTITNPITNNLLGIFCSATPIDRQLVPEFIWRHLSLRDNSFEPLITANENTWLLCCKHKFTATELDVIFFYLLGYSVKEIVAIWRKFDYNLKPDGSYKTEKNIRDIKAQIAYKLNKPELNQSNGFISFFKKEGFHNYTPENIYTRFGLNYAI